jgi:hypothetical protein
VSECCGCFVRAGFLCPFAIPFGGFGFGFGTCATAVNQLERGNQKLTNACVVQDVVQGCPRAAGLLGWAGLPAELLVCWAAPVAAGLEDDEDDQPAQSRLA